MLHKADRGYNDVTPSMDLQLLRTGQSVRIGKEGCSSWVHIKHLIHGKYSQAAAVANGHTWNNLLREQIRVSMRERKGGSGLTFLYF